jgi:hypothetical protein
MFVAKKDNKNQKGRGYFQSMYDRYVAAAKDANSSGDKVLYEYNMQYAEHYIRIINEKFQDSSVGINFMNSCREDSNSALYSSVPDQSLSKGSEFAFEDSRGKRGESSRSSAWTGQRSRKPEPPPPTEERGTEESVAEMKQRQIVTTDPPVDQEVLLSKNSPKRRKKTKKESIDQKSEEE